MSGLFLAFTLFVALHSIPAIPVLRSRIVATIGRPAYIGSYSAVSTALLVWLFYEALNTDYVELWTTSDWQLGVTFVAAPLGLFLVVAGLLSPNPFSVTMRGNDGKQGAIIAVTRHPVLWGFLFWSAGHLFPNGDLRSLVLFGGFAVFSAAGIMITERRSARKLSENWSKMAGQTSVLPFLAILAGRQRPRLDLPLLAGAAISLVVTIFLLHGGHAALFGADPLLSWEAVR